MKETETKHVSPRQLAAIQKRKERRKNIRNHKILYLFVLPGLIYLLIFNYYPLYGVQIAFQQYRVGEIFGQSTWVGAKHFLRFFKSYWFGTVVKNTLVLSLLSTIINFPLPIILALMLNEVRNARYKKFVQTVTYIPHFISLVVLCGAIQLFLSPESGIMGIGLNALRELLGKDQINLLTTPGAFKWIYVLSGTWQGTGWSSVIYFAALAGSDAEILEAAEIDGASKLQKIWYINLPVLVPTIVTCLILHFGGLLNTSFDKVYLLQNDSILSVSETINTYVYRSGIGGAQYSFSAAVGLLNSAVNAFLLLCANQVTRWLSKENSLF